MGEAIDTATRTFDLRKNWAVNLRDTRLDLGMREVPDEFEVAYPAGYRVEVRLMTRFLIDFPGYVRQSLEHDLFGWYLRG